MRPRRIVVVTGTGTEVGKTWVAEAIVRVLVKNGHRVAARKPAQSFSPEESTTDADRLAAASGETPTEVCPSHRWYPVPMAPPIAAGVLGRPVPELVDLVDELAASWPIRQVEVGVVEGAGGVASPQASDGDMTDLCRVLGPEVVVVVADPGLGTINSVRLANRALAPHEVIVYLNRFNEDCELHRCNRDWLVEHDGLTVTVGIAPLVSRIAGDRP
ncbi:MAG: ATP-dependent dethiobiotin synthetase BioD [Acidimicrobiales bacterium]